MLGIVVHLPPFVEQYISTTPVEAMAAHAILAVGWFPIFAVLVWGMAHVWLDFKQEKYAHHLRWTLLEVKVPQNAIQTPKGMETFFTNLAGSRSSITWREKWLIGKEQPIFSFEIASLGGNIHFYIRCVDRYRDLVEADLYAQYPEAQIMEVEDYATSIPTKYPNDEWEAFGAEFILSKPTYLPIKTYEEFEHQGEKEMRFKDPLFSILELMGKMQPGENFWIQIVIRMPDSQDWAKDGGKFAYSIMGKEEKKKTTMSEELIGSVTALPKEFMRQVSGFELKGAGAQDKKSDDFRMFKLTPAEKIQIEGVTKKISKIGWQSKVRIVYSAKKNKFRKGMMASGMKGIMATFTNAVSNQFGMHNASIPKDDYFWMEWQYAGKQTQLTKRYAARSLGAGATPYILNVEELATLWHFPAADARTPVLSSLGARRAEAPLDLPFAEDADGDGIPDWKQRYGKTQEQEEAPADLGGPAAQLPTPTAPTFATGAAPEAGKPAPLPPGLDLRDEPLPGDTSAPNNLPL